MSEKKSDKESEKGEKSENKSAKKSEKKNNKSNKKNCRCETWVLKLKPPQTYSGSQDVLQWN